jgi:beta-glucosidase
VARRLPAAEGAALTRSFGINHYGTSYTTGKRLARDDVVPFRIGFGHYEMVYEKDGKPIGVKGHNGHPYNGEWWKTPGRRA